MIHEFARDVFGGNLNAFNYHYTLFVLIVVVVLVCNDFLFFYFFRLSTCCIFYWKLLAFFPITSELSLLTKYVNVCL